MSTVEPLMNKLQGDRAMTPINDEFSLRDSVKLALERYLDQLDGFPPANVYEMVLAEIEIPLLETILRFTRGNQSKAAIILGISRGTLRKKLKIYDLEN